MTEKTGAELRDSGMAQALNHADEAEPTWSDQAYEFVCEFAERRVEFRAEQVREHAERFGLPVPPSARAWGGVINRAVKASLIKRVRFDVCSNAKAHRCNVSVWRGA